MPSKIANYFHTLKARIIVAYALFYTLELVHGVSLRGIWRKLKRNIAFLIKHPVICFNQGFPVKIGEYTKAKEAMAINYTDFLKQYITHRKTPLADYVYVMPKNPSLGNHFPQIIGVAWLCEKLGINVKFTFPGTRFNTQNFFENSVLNYAKKYNPENFSKLKNPLANLESVGIFEEFAKCKISSEYGYKIISRLSIQQEIQQQADQWYDANIKGACVGVHYRQTDVIQENRIISIDSYIDYLEQVLDDHCQIYACSDTASFIDAIHETFPNRVASRDITRSQEGRSLQFHVPYAGPQQRQDAFIDMLTLAKCKMIYTVGSFFIDAIRFFNPAIKIVSLDGRGNHFHKNKNIPNYMPVPRVDLVQKARTDTTWKEGLHYNKLPHYIEK